jgi:TonB family protein
MKTGGSLLICLALFTLTLCVKGQKSSTDFQPPQVISTVAPSYPPNAVAGGTVILKVTVNSSGGIGDVQVLQEAKGFTQQAIETVRKWRFEPAKLDGRPVEASIPVAFSFSQPIVWWNHQRK